MVISNDGGKVKLHVKEALRPDRPRMERVTAWSENLEGEIHGTQHR